MNISTWLPHLDLSPDGLSYWDGVEWRSLLSPDGRYRWNGQKWVPLDLADILVIAESDLPVPIQPEPGGSELRGRRSTKAESVLAGIRGKTWSKKAPPKLVNATRVLVALLVLATGAIGATSPRFDPSPAGSMAGQTDADRAAYLVLTVADVGSSWTLAPIAAGGPGTSAGSGPVGRVRGRGVDRLTIDGCLARFHGDTAASSVTYRLRSDTSSHQGYASTGGRTLATTSAAGEMLQAMSSGAQDSCLAASLADYAWNCGCPGGTTSVGKPDL